MFKEEIININGINYIDVKNENCNFLFSLKNSNGDFKRNTLEFNSKLKELLSRLGIISVGYSEQIHSSIINVYDGSIKEGDSTISDEENTGVCVYTADCVPILIKHKFLPLKAAIHSGWKGTYDTILLKTINFLKDKYEIDVEDLICAVGPHIRYCCYEVSSEIVDDFNRHELYNNKGVAAGRFLNLTKCIELQFDVAGIPKKNYYLNAECTKCSSIHEFYSYRIDKDCGRILSLVY